MGTITTAGITVAVATTVVAADIMVGPIAIIVDGALIAAVDIILQIATKGIIYQFNEKSPETLSGLF